MWRLSDSFFPALDMSPHVGESFPIAYMYHSLMHIFPATLRLFPGITATTVRAFLALPTRGVVLETFGAGNAPQRADLIGELKEACDRGVVIVSISQCAKGSVSDAYETGRNLLTAGVVSGGDMTPEVSSPIYCLSSIAVDV